VVGLGRIGLPAAVNFASAGFRVSGFDVDIKKIRQLRKGHCDFHEPRLQTSLTRLQKAKRLSFSLDLEKSVRESDLATICVPTPISSGRIDLTYLLAAIDNCSKALRRGQLIVVESTVAPGICRKLVVRIERTTNLVFGRDFFFAYAPERVTPGNAIHEMKSMARIVASDDPRSLDFARRIYNRCTASVLASNFTDAELAKLAENSFRYVNIAYANELALVCEKVGADVSNVARLANSHPRVRILTAGAGVGGPCLPKDTQFLASLLKHPREHGSILWSARSVNEYMPQHIIKQAKQALKTRFKSKSTVTILGLAYKPNVDDARGSTAVEIARKLLEAGFAVKYYDPYVKVKGVGQRHTDIYSACRSADLIVIAVAHDEIVRADLERIGDAAKPGGWLFDIPRVFNESSASHAGLQYRTIGARQVKSESTEINQAPQCLRS